MHELNPNRIQEIREEIKREKIIREMLDDTTRYSFSFNNVKYLPFSEFKKSGLYPRYEKVLWNVNLMHPQDMGMKGIFISELPKLNQLSQVFTSAQKKRFYESVDLMHKKGIVHNDIHYGNILQDKNKNIILIDWDKAKIYDDLENEEFIKSKQKELLDIKKAFKRQAKVQRNLTFKG